MTYRSELKAAYCGKFMTLRHLFQRLTFGAPGSDEAFVGALTPGARALLTDIPARDTQVPAQRSRLPPWLRSLAWIRSLQIRGFGISDPGTCGSSASFGVNGRRFSDSRINGLFFKGFSKLVTPPAFVVVLLLLWVAPSGAKAQQLFEKDTTIILLSDLHIQLECQQALNDLYNFKFPQAEYQFRYLRAQYGWHPLPYFLMGLIEWWKIMPNTNDTSHDDVFLAYMDSTIRVGERLYDDFPAYKIESAFFLAAAYGFKGRLYADEERKAWVKAAAVGKSAINYLEESKTKEGLSPELLFGDALYNYFSVWVPENYPALKPVLWFFRKGDKALGLQQLKEVSYNAFYTRTEAMVWLMRILNSYENDQPRAFQLSEYLHETYPDNPYFHRYYARMLYYQGKFTEAEPVCKAIINRIDSSQVGYEATSGRYAAFFLGQIYEARKKYEEAKGYYKASMKYAEAVDAEESGYYLFSMIALGEIAQREGDKAEAKKWYKEVTKQAGRKDEAWKDAKRRLKRMERSGD